MKDVSPNQTPVSTPTSTPKSPNKSDIDSKHKTKKLYIDKSSLIKNTISDITGLLPKDETYHKLRYLFQYQQDKLYYTPPELLDNIWVEIYHQLTSWIPINSKQEDQPEWKTQIEAIWNNNCQQYNIFNKPNNKHSHEQELEIEDFEIVNNQNNQE